MQLSDNHLHFIITNLKFYGIKDVQLQEDVLDHICSHIENSEGQDFEIAYKEAIDAFGGYSAMQLLQQAESEKQLIRSFVNRTRNVYINCAINATVLLVGFLFYIFHWPFSGVLILIGFAQFIFITVPFVIFDQYKRKVQKVRLLYK